MGLTFHYSATLKNRRKLNNLLEEVTDICKSLNWKYNLFDNKVVKGISLAPENSESLWLTFDHTNQLLMPFTATWAKPGDKFYYGAFTKTQFAGADTHIALIRLLKYISKKYFSEIKVSDEGGYWETGDETVLRKTFARYSFLLDKVAGALSGMKSVPGETPESLADRIEKLLKDMDKEGL
jgi:hypothetical protein